jgi:hypothetical protein
LSLADFLKKEVPLRVDQYPGWRRQNEPPFFFPSQNDRQARQWIGAESVKVAEEILLGVFPFFGYSKHLGFPPNWQRNPLTGVVAPGGHWSKIDEFAAGDIKLWWEPSRFTWAYYLSRAYAKSEDERFAESFWQLLESWSDQNPPNSGVGWKCGQEASFRIMALCFALYSLLDSASSTPQRVTRLVVLVAAHARRIDAFTEYARSQKNNHGISEGVGLWTVGLLFPELKDSSRWKAKGKQIIEEEVRRQIYADGSYVQHSTNYHRVMLQDLAWAIRIGECNKDKIAPDIYDRLSQAVSFLHALTDPVTGWAPNYGANDGALVLPLSDCAFPDMRPALQSCNFLVSGNTLYPPGAWDEEMIWLHGIGSTAAQSGKKSSLQDLSAESGGYYTRLAPTSWAMLRAANYQDRPSHADQLHLDLWWHGNNVLCDAGTFSYNAAVPYDHAFAPSRYHNTVTVDDRDQMTRLSRFLWANWPSATVSRFRLSSPATLVLQGQHDGYANLGVIHRRAVLQANDDVWLVVDDLLGTGPHKLRLHWLFPDVPFIMDTANQIDLQFNSGTVRIAAKCSHDSFRDLVRAGIRVSGEDSHCPDPARGWVSRYYARKEPALSFAVKSRSPLPLRFVTMIALGTQPYFAVDSSFSRITVGSAQLSLSDIRQSLLFTEGK